MVFVRSISTPWFTNEIKFFMIYNSQERLTLSRVKIKKTSIHPSLLPPACRLDFTAAVTIPWLTVSCYVTCDLFFSRVAVHRRKTRTLWRRYFIVHLGNKKRKVKCFNWNFTLLLLVWDGGFLLLYIAYLHLGFFGEKLRELILEAYMFAYDDNGIYFTYIAVGLISLLGSFWKRKYLRNK